MIEENICSNHFILEITCMKYTFNIFSPSPPNLKVTIKKMPLRKLYESTSRSIKDADQKVRMLLLSDVNGTSS